ASWSQPFGEQHDVEHGLVADGELVVAGGDGPVALESADAALDGMPVPVDDLVESGRPAARRSAAGPVTGLVSGHRDSRPDAVPAQPAANRPRGVRLVSQDP